MKKTKYIIKGSVKHVFPDEDMAYFVKVADEDVVWDNQKYQLDIVLQQLMVQHFMILIKMH